MSDQIPPEQGDLPKRGGWRRPLSYLLLAAGAAGIVFNNQISLNTGLPVTFLQIATFALFIVGAIMFYSVRETADRVSSYREVFTSNQPADNPPPADTAPHTELPTIAPASDLPSKDAQAGEPYEK